MLASAGTCALVYWCAPSKDLLTHWSFGTAYTAIALLTLTLAIGPINVLRGSRQPVSSDFRRDVGLWACYWSLSHTIVGLQVHLRGRMSEYFFYPGDKWLPSRVRLDMFGLANEAGLIAGIIVLMLAAISNDWSLRRLGAGAMETGAAGELPFVCRCDRARDPISNNRETDSAVHVCDRFPRG